MDWYVYRMEERCDQIRNCKDKSDENNCKLIVFEDNYNEKVPPFTITEGDNSIIPAKIRVSTQLKNVLAISEFSHTIDLKIGITLKWYENRVLYHNLKTEEALNVLTDMEVHNQFWNIDYLKVPVIYICPVDDWQKCKFRSASFGFLTLSFKILMMMKLSK